MPWIVRLLIFVSVILLLEIYFIKKFSSSLQYLKSSTKFIKYKKFLLIPLFMINFIPVFSLFSWLWELITGFEIDLPEQNALFDIIFVYPFWFGMLTILQASVLLLPLDLLRIIIKPLTRKYKESVRTINSRLVLIVAFLSLLYVPLRILYDLNAVSSRETEYVISGLNPDLNGLRIGLISDIQADWYNGEDRIENYIRKLNEFKPDLVFIAGDMITHDKDYIPKAAQLMGKINSKYGIFACVGDHDNWAYDNIYKSRNEVISALKKFNITMLDNENSIININNATIGLTALTDVYSERIRPHVLDKLTSSLARSDLRILLTHQPNGRILEKAVEYKYNLMFAGHTHGGQVTILFPFINITPTLMETRYVKGDFHFGSLMMIVNRGLGMSIAPIRYNSTPEVTCLIVRDKKQ